MVNDDFMFGQRRRQLAYTNPTLSILQRKQDGPTLNQYYVSVSYWLRLHTSKNDDPSLGSCYSTFWDAVPTLNKEWLLTSLWTFCWYLGLTQKQVYNNTHKRRTSSVAFMPGRHCIGRTNYNTTQVDLDNNTRHIMTTLVQYRGDIIIRLYKRVSLSCKESSNLTKFQGQVWVTVHQILRPYQIAAIAEENLKAL